MWFLILCYCCCRRKGGPKISAAEKRKKWLRLVGIMSVREYGTRFISQLFYAFIIAESLTSMNSIWKDFREFSECNNQYTADLAGNISAAYSRAADQLSKAVADRSRCLAHTMDLKDFGVDIGIRKLTGGVIKGIFGWISPDKTVIPSANLSLESNTEKIMREVADDLSFLGKVAFWVRMVGFIMTFVTIVIILLKATYYTVEDRPWKPGTVGMMMRLVQILEVIAAYTVLVGAVILQAYLTDKACRVNVNNTVVSIPSCRVHPFTCEFNCTPKSQNFSSSCPECDIQYERWWEQPTSWPNILAVLFLFFLVLVIVLELIEAKKQKRLVREAADREKAEKEREKQRLLEEKRCRKEKAKKKKSPRYKPPKEQTLEETFETRVDIDSDASEEKPRRKSSTSKKKSSKHSSKSKRHDDNGDREINEDSDEGTYSRQPKDESRSNYKL